MKAEYIRTVLLYGIISTVAVLFIYTGLEKLLSYEAYTSVLKQSAPWLAPIGWIVSVAEFVIALLLVWPAGRKIGLLLSLAFMLASTVYLVSLAQRSYYLPCGCGGILEKMSLDLHIGINILIMAMLITALWIKNKNLKVKLHNHKILQSGHSFMQ